ncbi:nucleotidyltransferase family protein [Acinetobacter sp. Tr-809]|uniref:nucleotidyltransferase family protein n=1 Tax=Acinetobacter sp. Tr-809 TaxID=2608324 RepID=UPI001421DE12|nr:nucleotidyltransferase family protein [Acinetobacter sp. Tr-809]NIE98406.1 nucleotidyltransferase family protein [Acinetobacter sp. Tr-809]
MKNTHEYYQSILFELITHTSVLFTILQTLSHSHPQAYLSAGVLRNMVWTYLHGQSFELNNSDIDVIYHHALEINHNRQSTLQQELARLFPEQQWDVVNQALVHTWYCKENGERIQPLASIEHALLLWPDTATAIAVRLNVSGELELIAPFGLQDLFELKLRWNPALVSYATFKDRVAAKQWLQQWPKLQLVDPPIKPKI